MSVSYILCTDRSSSTNKTHVWPTNDPRFVLEQRFEQCCDYKLQQNKFVAPDLVILQRSVLPPHLVEQCLMWAGIATCKHCQHIYRATRSKLEDAYGIDIYLTCYSSDTITVSRLLVFTRSLKRLVRTAGLENEPINITVRTGV
jgi:hypothetical protein